GEGHSKVLFVAECTKKYPRIDMDKFLKLFTKIENFNFDKLQSIYYEYQRKLNILLEKLSLSSYSGLKAYHRDHKIDDFNLFFEGFNDNEYLNIIKGRKFVFNSDLNMSDFKNHVRLTEVKGTLQAYKLFYVGCSRAIDELVVLIEKDTVCKFENEFKE